MSRIRKRMARKTNPNLIRLIEDLLEHSAKNESKLWREVAEHLAKPRRKQAEVNLSKIQRYLRDGEVAIVPGKVLGSGEIDKPLKVAALAFSEKARSKIVSAGGECMSIEDLMKVNPKGSKVRILI
ncbi:LSU ribosomal protein L18AE [Archaeoglobus sulfaticallidus PM70-1]|uniref:Large ribosomal subunit protein eL18 n=1 Tax=Archaeoglobus sulfaticallidus PM70-1 TaxID=387631 RepID=N0BEG1_9EURY|nr:50S ribosomal protein L18e [Archaeoglobus sulfaticallidus]AGK60647.1 LSU ribosomal protein L18AE [Archaeoglobus sulfaticallidus PM70-1]